MSEQSSKRCVVLIPAGNTHYTRLFDELFSPAITEARLVPHCIHQSLTEPLPIDSLVHEIAEAAAVFADLSQNSDEIWLALGCAVALRKPLCLVSSRLDFNLRLDIQDLDIIPYPAAPFPSDYTQLKHGITNQLLLMRPNETAVQPPQPLSSTAPITASAPIPPIASPAAVAPIASPAPIAPIAPLAPVAPPAPVVSSTPMTPMAPSTTSLSEDLTAHEVLALSIIDLHASVDGLSPRALGLEMQGSESAHLTSHAMNSLKRRRFIERRPMLGTDGTDSQLSDNLFITWSGKNWLLHHRQRAKSHRSNSSIRNLMLSR
jgi:hypothetical protein